jgi:hypothetical protein
MALAKHKKANPSPKKWPRSGCLIMRNAAAGEYVKTSKAKKHPTTPTPREKGRMASAEVVLKPAYVRALGARTKMVRKSLEKLADAALKAEGSDESVTLAIELRPGEAEPSISSIPSKT